ncbi:MAG TPA: AI-2E family transporter, partial [Gaiellaceae bacterium]|nr:AI-2E family transporter [Gaiellaceae bacterium]
MSADPRHPATATRDAFAVDGRPNRRLVAGATLIAFAVVLAVCALLIGVWLVRETVVWLVAAGFLAFSIEPLIRIFVRRGVGRGLATTLAFLTIAGAVLFFAIALVPAITDGAHALQEKIPAYVDQLQGTSASDSLNADDAIQTAGDSAQGAARFFENSNKVLELVGGLASAGFAAFMIFTFTLYFLVYGQDLVQRASGLLPTSYRAPFIAATRKIYVVNRGYWYGKFLIGLIAALTTFLTMKLLGLPFAAPLSLFVGITDLIPNIGATLGTIPVVVVGLLEEPWKGVVAGAVLILYQQVENNLVTPKVFKETVEIHPFLSVVTVIVFTTLFGIVGALIAVPVTKAI